MATPFRFKNIEEIYNQGLSGDYGSFGSTNPNVAQYTRLQELSSPARTLGELLSGAGFVGNQVKKIVTPNVEQFVSPLVRRFQYIRSNQEQLLKFYASTKGLEFFAKQTLLYKTNQYVSPVGIGAGVAGLLPGIPLFSGIINSLTKNYNGHRDFMPTNLITQSGLSSLGIQGSSANFVGVIPSAIDYQPKSVWSRASDIAEYGIDPDPKLLSGGNNNSGFGLKNLLGIFAPAFDGDPKLYSQYIKDVRTNKADDRLGLLYNQLSNPSLSGEAEFNLDYDFNKFNHSKKDILGLFGRFFNRRYEEHYVSRPGALKPTDKVLYGSVQTAANKNNETPGAMGPLPPKVRYKFRFKNINDPEVYNFESPRSRFFPYTEEDSYLNSLKELTDRQSGVLANIPTIDYFFTNDKGRISEVGYNNSTGDVINQLVTSSLGLKNVGKVAVANEVSDKLYADLINFNIQFNLEDPELGKTKILQFRALLTDSITDTMNASYTSARYIGRADQVHSYDGFTRNISLGFVIYPRNPNEHPIIMEKLSILASLLTPSYSKKGKVMSSFTNNVNQTEFIYETLLGNIPRAPIVKLTIGNYIKEQYGYITNLTYSIKNSNLWDIYTELPMVVEVSGFNFVPIHDFVVSQENPNFIATNRNSFTPEESEQISIEIDKNQVG